MYPYPASEVNFLQNLPLISVSSIHPQLPSTQCTGASQAPWELHDSQCNRYPAPALFRTNLLLLDTSESSLWAPSHLPQVSPSQLPQSGPPAPGSPDSPTYPTQPNSSRPFTAIIPYSLILLVFFIALLWSGINYIFLFCPPFPSPLHMHALECKSYEGRAPGLIHHLAPLTYKTV